MNRLSRRWVGTCFMASMAGIAIGAPSPIVQAPPPIAEAPAIVTAPAVSDAAPSTQPARTPLGARIEVRRAPRAAAVQEWRASLVEGRPELRGFRAPLSDQAAKPWPFAMPRGKDDAPEVRAATLVARRLAEDGLLSTLAQAIAELGPTQFAAQPDLDRLRAIGVPVDWLRYFALEARASETVRRIARELAAGATVAQLQPVLAVVPFAFQPSVPGFRVATESGEYAIGAVRLQLASGAYFAGEGDGGSLDIARQLVRELDGVSFISSIEDRHLEEFLALARGWPADPTVSLLVLPESLPVAQWAQDNAKPGFDASGRTVILAPRYASRGEDGAVFVPGETFLLDSLSAAGQTVVQSPLLFQAGNVMAVSDPVRGERILLVGEAEIYRNIALGLTRAQAIEALRIEFGVDRCVVLPAVSFHIDYEVTVRSDLDGVVAFVNDSATAVRTILACALDSLAEHGKLDRARARTAREDLEAGRIDGFMNTTGAVLSTEMKSLGHFPESFAQAFSAGAADSGVGNLQRFLLAFDSLTAHVMPTGELPFDAHTSSYLRSFLRRDVDRQRLVHELEDLGWKVVAVPSLSEGDRGINYLNGVQVRGLYLMPAYGGIYAPLDRAAQSAFERVLGDRARVVPVLSGESQRRSGALHCAVSVLPRQ